MVNISPPSASGHTDVTSLFSRIFFPANSYCEFSAGDNQPRTHWQSFVKSIDGLGMAALSERMKKVHRMRHEDGATINPFEATGRGATSWALDILPLLITEKEWTGLEKGVTQRAHLLERLLADIYGPQELMQNGILPPELIFANPNFLRACHGNIPADGRYLPFLTVDLYRDNTGNFRVFRDYAANPMGLGYALENRIVLSRVFSSLYQNSQVCRLAPFFQTMHEGLVKRAVGRQEDHGIVLLSSGPECPLYFEHSLLSRYLGYPLVESQDLTVRNGTVYLKKLAGLERVEVIIRYLADDASDPFALREDTSQGVAGLIQSVREQNVVVINPPGSGYVDTPVLPAFMERICKYYGENRLLLDQHPAWWCGDPAGKEHVVSQLDNLVVREAMKNSDNVPTSPVSAINHLPFNYMAEEPLRPSVSPHFSDSGIVSNYVLLRVFVCASEEGFTVMPGGLAISSNTVDTLMVGNSEIQHSKDIWVLSEQPVEPISLLGPMENITTFNRGSDLPSRVADNLLWLGRYLERAEGRIRLLRAVYRRLSSETRPQEITELPFLLILLGSQGMLRNSTALGKSLPSMTELEIELHETLFANNQQTNIYSLLRRVQSTARNVRDRLSMDCWRVINRLDNFFEGETSDPLDHLEETLFSLSCFSGVAMESMTRGLGWRFMDLGRRVERAINQTNLLLIGLSRKCVTSKESLEALLEIADSIMTYRARYRRAFQLAPVLDLLLSDETNPKSLAFQLDQIAQHVEKLPRETEKKFETVEERIALEMLTSIRLLNLHASDICETGANSQVILVDYLETTLKKLREFAQSIGAHYLSRVPTTPHFSMLSNVGDYEIRH